MIRMLELEENVGDHLHQEEKKGGRMLAARDLEMLLGAGIRCGIVSCGSGMAVDNCCVDFSSTLYLEF